jgi:hypothetical protein
MDNITLEDVSTQLEYLSAQVDELTGIVAAIERDVWWLTCDSDSYWSERIEQQCKRTLRRRRVRRLRRRKWWETVRYWVMGGSRYTGGEQ